MPLAQQQFTKFFKETHKEKCPSLDVRQYKKICGHLFHLCRLRAENTKSQMASQSRPPSGLVVGRVVPVPLPDIPVVGVDAFGSTPVEALIKAL